ncbi:MAG: DNA/RNA non-specific endonuclease, partial [Bacteroidota bacterium]
MHLLKKAFTFWLALIALLPGVLRSQQEPPLAGRIEALEKVLEEKKEETQDVLSTLEELKLLRIQQDLLKLGYPIQSLPGQTITHSAIALSYNEQHEQANWVAHIITPEIIQGNRSRSNDFRPDNLILTGTPVTEDYWDSGFDRGHLAPSADFRWSQKALSESYYYSNMSPQRPGLNREIWAELEGKLREVVIRENTQLWVVTGGILRDSLPTIGVVNQVSIPEYYYKVALMYTGDQSKGIGFIIPNQTTHYPLLSFAIPIDSIENLTGINFFPALSPEEDRTLEGQIDPQLWVS